jgi:hypothetical protein
MSTVAEVCRITSMHEHCLLISKKKPNHSEEVKCLPESTVRVHNGTLQNGKVTQWNVLQNGTCYKMVRVTKWYVLQNSTCYKTVHFYAVL